jgi:hypothetical protein
MFRYLRCQHDWHIYAEKTLESPFEQLVAQGNSLQSLKGQNIVSMFQKKYIYIMACRLCGKVLKIVESNPVDG